MNRRAFMPISALMVALLLALVAAMTPFVVEREVAHAQTGSNVTTLTKLTVAAGGAVASETVSALGLMPVFVSDAAPASDGYVVYVANDVTQVTVDAEETHSQAEVTYSNDANPDTTATVTLATDDDLETKIDVKVTAQNEFDTATYTINVMRASSAADTIDTLASLSVMAGGSDLKLTPAFAATQEAASENDPGHSTNPYEANVSAATSSVVVSAAATHTGATVKTSSGTQMGDGMNDSFTLKAAGMDTTIMVKVTAQDKATSTTYHIKVNRAASTASKDTKLSVLKLTTVALTATDVDDSTVTDAAALTLSPTFTANGAPASSGYSASVAATVDTISVVAASSSRGATIAVMAGGTGAEAADDLDTDADEAIHVVTLATSGATTVKVEVTAADKATKVTYTITVTKNPAIGDATNTLKSLSVKAGGRELITAFMAHSDAGDTYSANVLSTRSSVVVNAVPSNRGATVNVASATASVRGTGTGPYTVTLGGVGNTTTFTVTVTPADGASADGVYTIAIDRAAAGSNVTTLTKLTVAAGGAVASETVSALGLMPVFVSDAAPASDGYVVYVANDVTQVTVDAEETHSQAEVTYSNDANPDTTATVTLATDDDLETKIDVKVTAQNEVDTATYTINVMRASSAADTIDTLASLSVMAGGSDLKLTPAFAATQEAASENDPGHSTNPYEANVSAATSSVVVSAAATHTGATVKTSSGTQMGDGMNDSFTLKAAGMDTTIMVKVTAQDKATSTTYHIKVNRAASTASKDTKLSVLKLTTVALTATDVDDSTVTDAAALTLSPTFTANGAPASSGYSASVAAAVDTISVVAASSSRGATIAVMAGGTGAEAADDLDTDADEAIHVVTLATSGATTVKVEVTAADKATKVTYTITVTKEVANNNNMLSSLDLGIDSMPPFSPGTISYRAVAPSSMASLDVMATSAHPKADVKIRKVVGAVDGAGDPANTETDDMKMGEGIGSVSAMVPIGVGLNTITIEVDPVLEVTTSGLYTVVIRREMSDDATLSALSLGDDVRMSPTFAGTRTQYTAKVPTGTTHVTVMPEANHDNAKMNIMPADNDADMEGHQVAISGDGTVSITVKVTAEDGERMMTYMVDVSTVSNVATLSSLSLKHLPMNKMAGMPIELTDMDGMAMAFDSGEMMYYADAGSAEEITVTAMAMHSEAMVSVTVNGTDAMKTDVATYWDMLGCPAMNDAVGADDEADDATSPYCTTYHPDATHPGLSGDAKALVDETFANYYDIPLMVGENNTITVTVTAEDGTTMMPYTIMVTRDTGEPVGNELLNRYDADDSGHITLPEVNMAIDDYFNGDLTLAEVNKVIDLYFM